ncbi:MAG: ParB/RepB/Spo0J family partition protein [Pseudomonadota bacterium]|nr:ParB/RepB/Spo0J family partition protein [Pseudomonadota bacterium]
MAKRRKLEAPSADDLTRLEEEFRRDAAPKGPMSAPIAQVAADTAQAADLRSTEERAEIARNRSDAERLREVESAGRLIAEIPLDEIDEMAIIRDRMSMDAEELDELKRSISAHGLRLPIEVFERPDPGDGKRYGLLSGYRRFMAIQGLRDLWEGDRFDTIRAVVRDPGAMGGTFVAMVEENEVRADLSHFERGRISVLAAQEGAFANTEAAVDALFAAGSKAKRSKIRSFALIFEELGDMLVFPESLREKDGLKLATALRSGGETALRDALAEAAPETPDEELAVIMTAIEAMAPKPVEPSRGGRPRRTATRSRTTDAGVRIDVEQDGSDWVLRLSGDRVDSVLMRTIAQEVEALLSRS